MGTNYYWHANPCEHCGRADEPIHIGKCSAGWTFSFHATDEIRSYADWIKKFQEPGYIENEYREKVSLEEFKRMIEEKRGSDWNHARDVNDPNSNYHRTMRKEYGRQPRIERQFDDYLDAEGHSFSPHEFC